MDKTGPARHEIVFNTGENKIMFIFIWKLFPKL